MTLRILFFSVLRDRTGEKEIEITMDPPVTTGDLWHHLAQTYAAIAPYGGSVKLAVNHTYVDDRHPLSDGDEVAIITPVSGG
ncbi:MAG: MoaD/ThiS family protein [Rhodothermales bacterium]